MCKRELVRVGAPSGTQTLPSSKALHGSDMLLGRLVVTRREQWSALRQGPGGEGARESEPSRADAA